MSCGVGHRHGSDLVMLWLWRRPAATVLIRPLAWEPPYAVGVALKRTKDKDKNKTKNKTAMVCLEAIESRHVALTQRQLKWMLEEWNERNETCLMEK